MDTRGRAAEAMASFSDLPRETLVAIVGYLTLQEKQTIASIHNCPAWIGAVRDELRRIVLIPNGDSENGMNVNRSLDFVRDFGPNLQHFSLAVPKHLMLQGTDEDYFLERQWFLPSLPSLVLGGQNLASAARGCAASLKSFRLWFDEGCKREVFQILREAGGIGFLADCTSLEILECDFLALARMEQLAETLSSNSQTLRVVKLDNLGFLNSPLWPEPHAMTEALGNLSLLQQLSLVYHQLMDTDIATILQFRCEHLKSLTLRSDFCKNYMALIDSGLVEAGLTDISLELVALQCPNLQHLDVAGNPAITSAGIEKVFDACPLRELAASSCNIRSVEWKHLVQKAPPTLLLVAFDLSFSSPNTDSRIMEGEITSAIVASGGQVIFCETERWGVVKANEYVIEFGIAERQRESASRIQELIELQLQANRWGIPEFHWSRLSVFAEGFFARLGAPL